MAMSRRNLGILVGGLLTLIVIVIGFLVGASGWGRTNAPSPSPSALPTITPSPTPSSQILSGEITDVGEQPVAFQNSILITISEGATSIPVYVPPEAMITDAQGRAVSRNRLLEGMDVRVEGTPTEGGMLATDIQILSFPSPTPRATIRPTPTVSPTTTPPMATTSPSPSASP